MEVGIKVSVYNNKMRERRKELGVSQKDLACFVGTNIDNIGRIERLQNPRAIKENVSIILTRIAKELYIDFDILFPKTYLDALHKKRLLRRSYLIRKVELRFDELPPGVEQLQLPSPEKVVETIMLKEEVEKLLLCLSEREAEIIKYRYGLGGQDNHLLEEVAVKYKVSRERIRQIIERAFSKLRHPTRAGEIRDFLGD